MMYPFVNQLPEYYNISAMFCKTIIILIISDIYGKCTNKNNGGCYRDKGNIPPIASGKIRTKNRFSFKYGRVEYRAKMPGGDWHWPGESILNYNKIF